MPWANTRSQPAALARSGERESGASLSVWCGGRYAPANDMTPTSPKKSVVHRALELAKSGRCETTADVLATLKKEGHETASVLGPWMMRFLRQEIDRTTVVSPQPN